MRLSRIATTAWVLALGVSAVHGVRAAPAPPGLQQNVVLSEYGPWSASNELMRRLLSPLAIAGVPERLARSSERLEIDRRYGGLAAPKTVELQAALR